MTSGSWTDVVAAIGGIMTPVVVVILGVAFARNQTRNDELLRARIEYYKSLIPELNTLMCYMTFIGNWRDVSPPEVVQLKRRMDATFYSAAPLFSDAVRDAYTRLSEVYFSTFNQWGQDAKIISGAYRRKQAWQREPAWDDAWDGMFTKRDTEAISSSELTRIRQAYDTVVAAVVRDLDLTRARAQYTTDLVSMNAHAPRQPNIEGRSRG